MQRHPVPAVVPLGQPLPPTSDDEPQPLMQPQKPEDRQPTASDATPSPEHASVPPAASAAAVVGGEQPPAQQLPLAEPPTTATATDSSEQKAMSKEGAPTSEQQQLPSSFGVTNVQHLGEDLNTYLKAIIQDPKNVRPAPMCTCAFVQLHTFGGLEFLVEFV